MEEKCQKIVLYTDDSQTTGVQEPGRGPQGSQADPLRHERHRPAPAGPPLRAPPQVLPGGSWSVEILLRALS